MTRWLPQFVRYSWWDNPDQGLPAEGRAYAVTIGRVVIELRLGLKYPWPR